MTPPAAPHNNSGTPENGADHEAIRTRAEAWLGYFEFEMDATGMTVVLADDTPDEVRAFIRAMSGSAHTPDDLACLYEAVAALAEHPVPEAAHVDEKVCPLDLLVRVREHIAGTL